MTTTDPKLIEPVAWMYSRGGHSVLWPERKPDYTSPVIGFTETPLYTAAAINEAVQKERAGILETVLNIRATNAGNFDREGAAWEAYDRACLDIHAAIEAHKESQPSLNDALKTAAELFHG